MKYYDYKKAKSLIEENKDNLSTASLGMHEDWFWTADTVWMDGEYKVELIEGLEIDGIDGSKWATPALQLEYKDGSEKMIPCFKGESDVPFGEAVERGIEAASGVISSEVQANITPLSE